MSKRMMILRVPVWIEQLMCFVFKIATVFQWIRRNCRVRRRRVCDGYEEAAGTHEKFDQSTGEVLIAVGCRDDRPIVDSGSVMSMCPVDYATSVPDRESAIQYEFGECVG